MTITVWAVVPLNCVPYPKKLAKTPSAMRIQQSDSEILTLQEVSTYLKVTERTIYRHSAARKIPEFKGVGAWCFSRSEIDLWIQSADGGVRCRR